MSKEAHPNFRVNVYGSDPNRVTDIQRDMADFARGAGRGSGGGLPWFGGNNSPTYPTGQSGPYQNNGVTDIPEDVGPQNEPGAGGAGAAGGLIGGMTMAQLMRTLAAAGLLGASAIGGNGSGSGTGSGTGNTLTDQQIQEALALQNGRLKKSEPLYDAIMQMAGGLMPTQYQPRWPSATSSAPPPPGGSAGSEGPPLPEEQPPAAARRY